MVEGGKCREIWQEDLFDSGERSLLWQAESKVQREDQAKALRELAKGDMVRVAPEEYAWVPRENCKPEKYVMCRWSKAADGKFRPVPIGGNYVRLTPDVASALGFRHLDRRVKYETIMRMWRAELIDMLHITPGCYLLDLSSWYRHLAECAENPDMWDKGGEARAEYRYKNGLG